MRYHHYFLIFLCFAFAKAGTSQTAQSTTQGGAQRPAGLATRTYISHELKLDKTLEVQVSDGKYIFRVLKDHITETLFIPEGVDRSQLAASHAVVLNNTSDLRFKESDDGIYYGSHNLELTTVINKDPFEIKYVKADKEFIKEGRGYVKNDSFHTIELQITDDEVLYGGGARALGMNRRGNRLQLYNRAHYGYETRSELMNFTLPIVISSKSYMIHFDNAPIGFLDLDSKGDNTITYETISGVMRYQVITGSDLQEVTENYTDLTGKQPMPPRWALGNFSSRFGYHSQKEVLKTIDRFNEEAIPVDAVILDLYWFGKDIKGTMGNLKFHRDSFPDPEAMIKNLKDRNVETILITEPFILSTSDRWEEAVEKNILAKDSLGDPYRYEFYFGNTGLIDIYSDTGNKWFKDIYKNLSNMGVNGFWGDLGEPEVHPSDLFHATGTADEVHNIYGHDWAKLVYEASLEADPNRRPFVLMRAGYSGSQRYGLIPWSGDVNRTWGGLQSQPEIALQMGMQGLGYMHSDLGGFAGANLDDELYVRWLQYGVFQPIYRPHAQEDVASEPVYRSEKAMKLAKKAIELRYKLLPYNYQLAFENHTKGTPLMRPVSYEDPKRTTVDHTSYMWGDAFFITPIKEPGIAVMDVDLPTTSLWFDFYTNKLYEGGLKKDFALSDQYIPTFIKAGSFIPMSKGLNTTKEFNNNVFELHYYMDVSVQKSEKHFYSDDGSTFQAYEKGMYEILKYTSTVYPKQVPRVPAKSVVVEMTAETGSKYSTSTKFVKLIIHGIDKRPRKIKKYKTEEWEWDETTRSLHIDVKWNTAKSKKIKIIL